MMGLISMGTMRIWLMREVGGQSGIERNENESNLWVKQVYKVVGEARVGG